MTTQTKTISQLQISGLTATDPDPLPFGDGSFTIRSYRLERAAGDLVIYASPGMARDVGSGGLLGEPIRRHYLNHWHEAMFLPDGLDHFDTGLVVHEAERASTEERTALAVHSFSRRHFPDDDLEVIPIPGHTPGATAYLWETGEHRLLFTGDSLFVSDDDWQVALLDNSDPAAYAESLRLIAELDFDVLVPWLAETGADPFVRVEPGEAEERLSKLTTGLHR